MVPTRWARGYEPLSPLGPKTWALLLLLVACSFYDSAGLCLQQVGISIVILCFLSLIFIVIYKCYETTHSLSFWAFNTHNLKVVYLNSCMLKKRVSPYLQFFQKVAPRLNLSTCVSSIAIAWSDSSVGHQAIPYPKIQEKCNFGCKKFIFSNFKLFSLFYAFNTVYKFEWEQNQSTKYLKDLFFLFVTWIIIYQILIWFFTHFLPITSYKQGIRVFELSI